MSSVMVGWMRGAAMRNLGRVTVVMLWMGLSLTQPLVARATSTASASLPASAEVAASAASVSENLPAASEAVVQFPADIPVRRDPAVSGAPNAGGLWPFLGVMVLLASLIYGVNRMKRGTNASGSGPVSRSAATLTSWRHWLPNPMGAPVQVLGSQRLTARHSVHVLVWKEREYLVACTDGHVAVVDSQPVSAADAAPKDGMPS